MLQVGVALHNSLADMNEFPAGLICPPTKENPAAVGLSWRVQLLPYLEQQPLYEQFHLSEPWDSEHNSKLVPKMPEVFASPGKTAPTGLTYLQAFRGPSAFLATPPQASGRPAGAHLRGRAFREFADGTSNTLAVAESATPVIWTKPDDLDCDGKAVPKLGGVFAGGFHG